MNWSDQQMPEAAKPVLASRVLELEELHRTRFTGRGRSERLKTGCLEVDALFGNAGDGGLERGVVLGISAQGGEERLITLHLLASVLLPHLPLSTPSPLPHPNKPKPVATIIDTTGSFPVNQLAQILQARVPEYLTSCAQEARRAGKENTYEEYNRAADHQNGNDEREKDAVERCLEMVAIERVFDIEGLWEVLGEIGRPASDGTPAPASGGLEEEDGGAEQVLRQEKTGQASEKPAEIGDSEDELSPVDEVFFPTAIPSPRPSDLTEVEFEGTEIIIIDNMTNITSELLARKEKTDAHTLLSLLAHTLHTLSQTQNILTIIHNGLVASKPTFPPHQHQQQPQHHYHHQHQKPPPLPTNPLKPALGKIFTQFPSLHVFLSARPQNREDVNADAGILYSQDDDNPVAHPDEENPRKELNQKRECLVLEVLKDETPNLGAGREESAFGWREGRWCVVGDRVLRGEA